MGFKDFPWRKILLRGALFGAGMIVPAKYAPWVNGIGTAVEAAEQTFSDAPGADKHAVVKSVVMAAAKGAEVATGKNWDTPELGVLIDAVIVAEVEVREAVAKAIVAKRAIEDYMTAVNKAA